MKYFFIAVLLLTARHVMAQPQQDPSFKRYDRFLEQPVTACSPRGWILEFLQRQRTGLTGHPEVLSYPFNTVLWAGEITRQDEQHGDNWWRYEQTAYYTDGLLKLGYLLSDSSMIIKAREGIAYTLSHVRPNGRLGPGGFASQWPIAVFFRVLQAEYLATGDSRIVEALHKHYLSYTPEEIGKFKRAIVNIEGALWTYGITGDRRLLELSEKAWGLGGFELNRERIFSDEKDSLHGVTYMEMAKLPALLYAYTGRTDYLQAAIRAQEKLERDHLLPDGVPSSNEFLAGKDPLHSHETCDISDYTWTLGYLLMVTGDGRWADKLEKAVFNAAPGAVSKDFRNLQYFSSVNQVVATGHSNNNAHAHGSTWMAYWPCHETECCAGNVHRIMPNFAARMWMRDREGGMVAALYGPSVFRFDDNCVVSESTGYPFDEEVRLDLSMKRAATIPLSLRIPSWCKHASVLINGEKIPGPLEPGSFVTIRREFRSGDQVKVILPMEATVRRWEGYGCFVERGPLLYAFPVPGKVAIDTAHYANLGTKRSEDPSFPALDLRPAGVWTYAIPLHPDVLRVIRRMTDGYPYDPSTVPLTIEISAYRLPDKPLQEGRYTPAMPAEAKVPHGEDKTTIRLVPYGSTRLRITVFPVF
ncbi:MAG: beta-L-arabinofuranosidase domain-containing protein, partial [Chitinophaga rupis]